MPRHPPYALNELARPDLTPDANPPKRTTQIQDRDHKHLRTFDSTRCYIILQHQDLLTCQRTQFSRSRLTPRSPGPRGGVGRCGWRESVGTSILLSSHRAQSCPNFFPAVEKSSESLPLTRPAAGALQSGRRGCRSADWAERPTPQRASAADRAHLRPGASSRSSPRCRTRSSGSRKGRNAAKDQE